MSLPSTELANLIGLLAPATGKGLSAGSAEALLVVLVSIRAQVVQLEACAIPQHLRAVVSAADGNVVPFNPRPAAVPPQGGAA